MHKTKRLVGVLLLCGIQFAGWSTAYTIHNKTVAEIPLENYYIKTRIGSPTANIRQQNRLFGASIGINGTFFCPAEQAYSYCGANNSTSSDRIVAGTVHSKYQNDTGERGIIGVTADNEALFVQNNNRQGYMQNTNKDKIHTMHYGLGNFPILLDNGVDVIMEMGHLIDNKMYVKATRSFICIPESNDRIFMGFVPNKSIYEMPSYLKNTYNCHFAINLDAGRSSAMVVDDRYIVGPGRSVVDGFVAIPKEHYIENKIQEHRFSVQQQAAIDRLGKMFIAEIQQKGDVYKQKIIQTFSSWETATLFHPLVDKRAMLREMIKIVEQA